MKRLAIIGMGPRGLFALENLLIQLGLRDKQVDILVIEASNEPGAGRVWRTNQPDSNWINTAERLLSRVQNRPEIHYATIVVESFPSYHDWCRFLHSDHQPDNFPPRHKLGKYLQERFNTIYKALEHLDSIHFIKSRVQSIHFEHQQLKLISGQHTWVCDDVLLTVGHQRTQLTDQLKQWKSHIKTQPELQFYENAYPVSQFNAIKNKSAITIGIRGFGLTMVDVVKFLTINNFGNFKVMDHATFKTVYYKVNEQHLKLIPFSVFGLPLASKPLNKTIDNWYKPSSSELDVLKSEIELITKTKREVDSISFFTNAFAQIAARVFIDLKEKAMPHSYHISEIKELVLERLINSDFTHELLQDETISTYSLIQNYIDMALGDAPITLDYCIGQVWRYCQPTIYKAFSHAEVHCGIIESIIELNEQSKRYSFGPPIESMQQILALVDANILSLDFIKNPDIKMTSKGWLLKSHEEVCETCTVIINSVMDVPKLLEINSLIVKSLVQNGLVNPIHSELGIETFSTGYVKVKNDYKDIPIAVLGRLAKGSVLGVDSISECFGSGAVEWAKSYVQKLDN